MKILSVFMSVLLLLSMCLTAYASEISETTEPIETHYMGDFDENGYVDATDARYILRRAVGLDEYIYMPLFYCDMDYDGKITASDARLALRTVVSLEEKQAHAFEIVEDRRGTCTEEGIIRGKCVLTGQEVFVTEPKTNHVLPHGSACTGKGICNICGQEITVEINHTFINNYKTDKKVCTVCGHKEPLNHVHRYGSDYYCECGKNIMNTFIKDSKNYLMANGTKDGNCYYVEDYADSVAYALIYDKELGYTYAYCGFGLDVNGTIVYYDFNFDFKRGTVELLVSADETPVAYARGRIHPVKVDESADGDSISIVEHEEVSGMGDMDNLYKQMMEGAVYEIIQWLKDYAPKIGIDYMDHIFTDYKNAK